MATAMYNMLKLGNQILQMFCKIITWIHKVTGIPHVKYLILHKMCMKSTTVSKKDLIPLFIP